MMLRVMKMFLKRSSFRLGILLVLVISLALVVSSCGSDDTSGTEETGTTQETEATESGTGTQAETTEVASTEKPFYEGKTIKLIVSTKPGGGYDTYGRMVAKFMEEQLPGSTIVVKNVPGAGHIIGCNEIYMSEPDGLTFGTFNRGLPLAQIAGLEGIEFDLSEMSWLGSPASEHYSCLL